jgi:hypothetical protein
MVMARLLDSRSHNTGLDVVRFRTIVTESMDL